jgi:hypothetical protein
VLLLGADSIPDMFPTVANVTDGMIPAVVRGRSMPKPIFAHSWI